MAGILDDLINMGKDQEEEKKDEIVKEEPKTNTETGSDDTKTEEIEKNNDKNEKPMYNFCEEFEKEFSIEEE